MTLAFLVLLFNIVLVVIHLPVCRTQPTPSRADFGLFVDSMATSVAAEEPLVLVYVTTPSEVHDSLACVNGTDLASGSRW